MYPKGGKEGRTRQREKMTSDVAITETLVSGAGPSELSQGMGAGPLHHPHQPVCGPDRP